MNLNGSTKEILNLVNLEAVEITRRFGGFRSAHEAASVLREEFEEFWAEVKKKQADRHVPAMVEELIQVAAVAVRYAAQLRVEGVTR